MTNQLFKVTYRDREELEQAASYLEVASRVSPQVGEAVTLFVDSGAGPCLYTTASGIRILHGLFRVPDGDPIAWRDLPADVVHRFGPLQRRT